MTALTLSIKTRTVVGKKLLKLRQQGLIPGVIYGHQLPSRNVLAAQRDFMRVWKTAGGSALVDAVLDDGVPVKVLIQEVQCHPVTRELLHVDFHQVNLKEKITARIKLRFTGVASAVKELGGVLMTNLSEVAVSCLPEALVPEISVDVSRLKTFHDYVHVRDLPLPPGMTVLEQPEAVVVHVIAPRSEEELKALEQQPSAPTAAEVPVVGKEVKQENAAESTAAAAPAKTKT